MTPESFIGLVIICAFIFPAVALLILRRKAGLDHISVRWLLSLYVFAFLLQPVFLFRKLWEGALVATGATLPKLMLAQVDNGLWETVAKLLALVGLSYFARNRIKPALGKLSTAMSLGYWAGLAYGVGEAVVLAILFIAPALSPIFGMNTFTPFMLSWPFVYERFWAMQIHAIIGVFVGIGVWHWTQGRPWRFVLWFVVAMAYHDFVDGLIIVAGYSSLLQTLIARLGMAFVPLLTVIGYGLVALVSWQLNRRPSRPLSEQT
jgi:hypothetical protein